MADTDKAQIAALGRARLGTMYDYHRMWKAQRAAQGLPYDDATWEAWLVERLRTGDAEIERLRKENEQYVIWSHEHSAWWRPSRAGYCRDVCNAGVYSREEALSISHKWKDGWRKFELPNEIPVRVADLPEYARAALASEDE